MPCARAPGQRGHVPRIEKNRGIVVLDRESVFEPPLAKLRAGRERRFLGVERDGAAIVAKSPFMVAATLMRATAHLIGVGISRFQRDRAIAIGDGGFDFAAAELDKAETGMAGGSLSIQPQHALEIAPRGVELAALFGPEHGIRGDIEAGGKVASSVIELVGHTPMPKNPTAFP